MNTNQTSVYFVHDNTVGKWEVIVTNVLSEVEALQAFNAVVLTCSLAIPEIIANKAESFFATNGDTFYKISIGQ